MYCLIIARLAELNNKYSDCFALSYSEMTELADNSFGELCVSVFDLTK
jgi:hypothetical protein